MGWGLPEPLSRRAPARHDAPGVPAPPGRARSPLARAWLAVLALCGLSVLVPASAAAASPALSSCSGFAACSVGGYTTHGYQYHEWSSYWRMDPGDECTNYVAYVESTTYHVATPDYLLGNAGDWPANAAAHGVLVDDTPSVGAVAVWYGGSPGIGPLGHVAVVEEVFDGGNGIVFSQQHISADPDGYEWATVVRGGLANDWETFPDAFIHFPGTPGAPAAVAAAAPSESAPPVSDLVRGGDFAPASAWAVAAHSNYTTFPAGVLATSPASGARFGATNTTAAGGGIYQDVPLRIAAGASICADADVVTAGRQVGAHGAMALWLLGGGAAETASVTFGPLAGGDAWAPVTACVTAARPHTMLRVQFYPAPHAPTLAVDGVDAHFSVARDGSFTAAGSWHAARDSTLTVAGPRSATTPYEAGHYAATWSEAAGGGIYQDVPGAISAGESFCADAHVVTVGARSGAAGELVLWLLGGSHPEASAVGFGSLPGGSAWMPVSTCVTATIPHADLRIQFYVAPGHPALGVDAVDVHRSLAADAGFDGLAAGRAWRVAARSNFATLLGGGHATVAFEGSGFGATNTSAPGGGIYQDLRYDVGVGGSLCADAAVVSFGRTPGARGEMVLWLLGGGHAQSAAVPFGPLPDGNAWQRISVCTTAASPATDVRIQFYPAPGSPTLAVDAVDVR